MDNAERNGIHGRSLGDADGSVVAQALELENGDELVIEDVSAGDTLFFAELPEYTRDFSVQALAWSAGKGKEEGDAELASTTTWTAFLQRGRTWMKSKTGAGAACSPPTVGLMRACTGLRCRQTLTLTNSACGWSGTSQKPRQPWRT